MEGTTGRRKGAELWESVDELVRSDADLTQYDGIGAAISGAIREIVLTGTLRKLGSSMRSRAEY